MAKAPAKRRTRVEVAVAGDRRLAEEVLLEIRALAARSGIRIGDVTIAGGRTTGRAARRRR